jgi:hypothetical protein
MTRPGAGLDVELQDARQAARDLLVPDGRQLAELMDGLIRESARELGYIRGKLKARAESVKGISPRTLVEWHKAEGMLMARAKAISALSDTSGRPATYESLLRSLDASE